MESIEWPVAFDGTNWGIGEYTDWIFWKEKKSDQKEFGVKFVCKVYGKNVFPPSWSKIITLPTMGIVCFSSNWISETWALKGLVVPERKWKFNVGKCNWGIQQCDCWKIQCMIWIALLISNQFFN